MLQVGYQEDNARIHGDAEQSDAAGTGDAFAVDELVVGRFGTRSDRGACAQRVSLAAEQRQSEARGVSRAS